MTEAIFPIPNQTRLAHPLEFVMLQIEVRQASVSTVLMKQTKPNANKDVASDPLSFRAGIINLASFPTKAGFFVATYYIIARSFLDNLSI